MSAAQALQKAIFARLSSDAALTAQIGIDGVSDRLLTRSQTPQLHFAGIDSRDISTGPTEPGEEHVVTLVARNGEGGAAVVQAVASRVMALLHDAALSLEDHTLVSLLHRRTVSRRDRVAKGHMAEMEFRAVTE